MGTENTIFYKLRKCGICKYQERMSLADSLVEHIGCSRDNLPAQDMCRLDDCEFKDIIMDLATTFNNALNKAKGKKVK